MKTIVWARTFEPAVIETSGWLQNVLDANTHDVRRTDGSKPVHIDWTYAMYHAQIQNQNNVTYVLALHSRVSMLSTVLIWRHISLCDSQRVFVIFQMSFAFSWNLDLRYFVR